MLRSVGKRALKVGLWIGGLAALGHVVERYQFAKTTKLPKAFVLDVDFDDHQVVETAPSKVEQIFRPSKKYELRSLLEHIAAAGNDNRVKLLEVRLGLGAPKVSGLATIQDIRDAIHAFRDAAGDRGALAVAHAQSYGGAANGTPAYLIASACDKVWVMPTGRLSLLGVASQQVFARGLLDKYHIEFVCAKRREYKNAANMLTETGFTKQHREATEHILQEAYTLICEALQSDRSLRQRLVWWAMREAPLSAADALRYGFVSEVVAASDVTRKLVDAAHDGMRGWVKREAKKDEGELAQGWEKVVDAVVDASTIGRVSLGRYIKACMAKEAQADRRFEREEAWGQLRKAVGEAWDEVWGAREGGEEGAEGLSGIKREKGKLPLGESEEAGKGAESGGEGAKAAPTHTTVAVVTAAGPIYDGRRSETQRQGAGVYAADFVKTLSDVAKDESVSVVLLRVNSPGGSAAASELIARKIQEMKASGKQVVVSMGDLAASGGYYISAFADRIYAQPGTLTGSIGVIAGKFNLEGFLNRQGVKVETVDRYGPNAAGMSALSGFTPAQRRAFERTVDEIYDQFKSVVAEGRSVQPWRVERLAQGRVWPGRDALRLGIVDEIGGYCAALEDARGRALAALRAAGAPGAAVSDVRIRAYPGARSPVGELLQGREEGGIERDLGRGTPRERREEKRAAKGWLGWGERVLGAAWAVGVVLGIVSEVEVGGVRCGAAGLADVAAGAVGAVAAWAAGAAGVAGSGAGDVDPVMREALSRAGPEAALVYAAWLASGLPRPTSLQQWAVLAGQPMALSPGAEGLARAAAGLA